MLPNHCKYWLKNIEKHFFIVLLIDKTNEKHHYPILKSMTSQQSFNHVWYMTSCDQLTKIKWTGTTWKSKTISSFDGCREFLFRGFTKRESFPQKKTSQVTATIEPYLYFDINRACHRHTSSNSLTTRFRQLEEITTKNKFLPKILVVEADNAACDNKSREIIAFYCWIVEMGFVDSVVLLFMPVGHTHGLMGVLHCVICPWWVGKFSCPRAIAFLQADSHFGRIASQIEKKGSLFEKSDLEKVILHLIFPPFSSCLQAIKDACPKAQVAWLGCEYYWKKYLTDLGYGKVLQFEGISDYRCFYMGFFSLRKWINLNIRRPDKFCETSFINIFLW